MLFFCVPKISVASPLCAILTAASNPHYHTVFSSQGLLAAKQFTGLFCFALTDGAPLIASPNIEIGQSYVLTVGSDTYDITVSEQNTVIGTQPTSQGFGGRVPR